LGISVFIWINATFSSILNWEASPTNWWEITVSRWQKVHDFINSRQQEWTNLKAPGKIIAPELQILWWSPVAWKFLKATDANGNTVRETISGLQGTQWPVWPAWAKWDTWDTWPAWAKWDTWDTWPAW
jgi:hypothetical protein